MTAAIHVEALYKTYRTLRGPIHALKGLDLEVRAGEIFGFIGVNGAGKSTTIKSLLGLIRPTSGRATTFGAPCGTLESRARLGYLPEVANYHEFMAADELLAIHARLARVPSAQVTDKCAQALTAVGLGGRERSRLSEFSKGMKQRFGVAQAIVAEPPLLVLDELTSGLDPFAQRQLKDIMLDLKRKGITIFFSSHQMSEVETICDRAGIIHRGKMRAVGTIDELLARHGTDEIEFSVEGGAVDSLPSDPAWSWTEVPQGGRWLAQVQKEHSQRFIDQLRAHKGQVLSMRAARAHLEEVFHDLVLAVDREEQA